MANKNLDSIIKMLDDSAGVSVYINSPDEVYLEENDNFSQTALKLSDVAEINSILQELGQQVGRSLSGDEKAAHFQLPDGKRVASFRPPGSTAPLIMISA